MIFPVQKKPNQKQSSYLIAMIFGLIFLLGIISIITPNPEVNENKQNPTEVENLGSTRNVDYSAYYFRVMLIMVVSIGILIVGLRLYQRHHRVNDKSNLNLKILGRKYINSKQYFLKVFVDNKILLVGVSEHSMNLITELSDGVESEDKTDSQSSFSEISGKHMDIRDKKES